ncbi:integrase, partial [Alishewanella sp. WH16-1]
TSDLFIALLEKLKGQYRRAKSIRLIVDNYIIHKRKKTHKWLSDNPKFKLLFLPVYSPWHNKIEKLWHALHETITRNHQCKNMDDLLLYGHCRTVSRRQAWTKTGVSQLGAVI